MEAKWWQSNLFRSLVLQFLNTQTKKFQSTKFQQGNRKWLTGLKWFNFPWITDGKCWDPFLCSFIACFVLLFLKSFFAKIIFSEEVKLWKNCAHNRVQRYLSKESVNDESHHSTAHELTYAGPTKQQNGTKCKKPINQQNKEIFCYFIPKQQNEKPIFC